MKASRKRLAEALREMARTGDPRRLLIEHLGFDHPRLEAIDRERWSDEWDGVVTDARFVAERSGFHAAAVTVKGGTPARTWRAIATRIIVDYHGLTLVCVHADGGLRWLWSSPSAGQLRTAAAIAEGVRHCTVELQEDGTAPRGFLALLSDVDVSEAATNLDVLSSISAAFDRYTTTLQEDIGENTFEALRILTEGLLAHPANRLARTLETLERIRPEVFVLLYRFLFVLYAEAREVFPVRHRVYFERYSMEWWREKVVLPLEREGNASLRAFGGAKATTLWNRCKGLFHLINSGSRDQGHRPDEFDFRPYYGTIFDTELHRDLENWEIPNEFLAEAVRQLTRFRETGGGTFFVDYSSLEIRHLGSIYERMLEYRLGLDEGGHVKHTLNQQERKSTGSYFTPAPLIERLVADTLNPILERIRREVPSDDPGAFERAVYDLRICDPAMGSGHFLVGVLNHLARAIVDQRHVTGSSAASADELVEVKRTIVRRCLYGVDLNPLAVELAKMSLWLETVNSDRPLSFLDAHLKAGNSLVGAWFQAIDDPQRSLFGEDIREHLQSEVHELIAIERQEEIEAVDVKHKVHQYRKIRAPETRYGRLKRLLDAQIAEFFGAPVEDWRNARGLLRKPKEFDDFTDRPAWRRAIAVAERVRFFHWQLEFPEVFYTEDGTPRPEPGFDAVVGNPPWDKIKVLDREFFRFRAPEIARAQTAAQRKRMLERHEREGSTLWRDYQEALRDSEALADYLRGCGDYILSARGDINYYPAFLERALALTRRSGFVGMVTPTGIVTDHSNREFAQHLMVKGHLATLMDFENKGLFPDLHAQYRFSLLVLRASGGSDLARFIFFLHDLSETREEARWFELKASDVRLFNPNTRTIPVFRSRRDAEINAKMYRAARGVLRDETRGEVGNPWNVRYTGMFHMTNDSAHFRTREQLEKKGWTLRGNRFVKGGEVMIPLFEAKMIHLWNPRFATYHDATLEDIRKGFCRDATEEELRNPGWEPLPRYWVAEKTASDYWGRVGWKRPWVVVFRDITNATNERTAIATFAPAAAFGNKSPGLLSQRSAEEIALLVANLSCLPFDYCARNKVSGTNMNFFILDQLPVFPPEAYRRWTLEGEPLANRIAALSLSLACTSQSLKPLAAEAGLDALAPWDAERRYRMMRELDAIFAHLYGLSREEFAFILDTFPIVRESDMRAFGRFRTKEEALRHFDGLHGRLVGPLED